MVKSIRIATRQSPLALWQANFVKAQLLTFFPHLTIDLVPLVTSGDKFLKDRLVVIGGKGLFVKELEDALLNNTADIAVHSTKDMPAELPAGLSLQAFCKRENPFDAFVSDHYAKLQDLPERAIVGTSSLRRQSQLLALRSDLQIKTLRGNVNTRLGKLHDGEYDAIILAAAGLERMNMQDAIKEILPEDVMLPACGQGALCIECRESDTDLIQLLSQLNDPLTEICVRAERGVNAQLGGNCHAPLAVYCTPIHEQELLLRAKVLMPDGSQSISDQQVGPQSQVTKLVSQCTQALLNKGAQTLLDANVL